MVHYGSTFTESSASDMYSRSPYSAAVAAPFTAATTANSTYDTSHYEAAVAADSAAYYEHSYRQSYWQQPQTVKDETPITAYQPSGWATYPNRDSAEAYKQQHDYFTLQNTGQGHNMLEQQPAGLAMQYAPCAMMSSLSQQHAMEEEMAKERQAHGYNGWISGTTSTNCKTRTKDKYRVVYSDHQRLELEKEFHFSRYITIKRKAELAVILSLSERQVKIWFQNRRAKERKMNKKKSGDDSKSATEAESRSSPCSSDGNEGDGPSTPPTSLVL